MKYTQNNANKRGNVKKAEPSETSTTETVNAERFNTTYDDSGDTINGNSEDTTDDESIYCDEPDDCTDVDFDEPSSDVASSLYKIARAPPPTRMPPTLHQGFCVSTLLYHEELSNLYDPLQYILLFPEGKMSSVKVELAFGNHGLLYFPINCICQRTDYPTSHSSI
ncbi:unnamed protein product [Absidia cylindrospora]